MINIKLSTHFFFPSSLVLLLLCRHFTCSIRVAHAFLPFFPKGVTWPSASKQLAWQLGSNMSAFRFLMLISHRPLMNRTTWFSQYRQCKVGCTPYKTSSWRAYNENSHRSYRCRCSMKVHYMALFTPIAWIERQRTCPRCQPSTPYSLASVLQDPKKETHFLITCQECTFCC